VARVHGGLRQHGQEGTAVPCRRAGFRARRCSPVVVEGGEPDKAVSEGCSPEHERQWRGVAMVKKTDDGLSLLRGRRKARGSSRVGGEEGR
jgi:hypothetical protein